MNQKIIKIAIIVNILPSYREGFYDRLFSRKDLLVKVYCQDRIPGMNFKTIHNKYPNNIQLLKFFSAKREKLSWQFIPWKEILTGYDVVFIDGNPRNLSHALFSTYLRLKQKKVVLWAMAHSFHSYALTEKIRLLWSRLFKNIFVYTDAEVDFLRSIGFKKNFILGMNNGLDQKAIDDAILKWTDARLQEWRRSNALENSVLLLSCARLDAKNKFEQVIRALPLMLDEVPNLIWCVIGNGDEKNNLETMVKTAGLEDHVRFVGAIYQENELAPWFLLSEILIHPGAIGLTLLHSFGYGLPVVVHGETKLHGPEYAAFEPERTGRNFHIGDIQSLADTVVGLLYDRAARSNMKSYALNVARGKYNVDIMVERFVSIARNAYNA